MGALKYRAAELSSRLEMMQAQLSKVSDPLHCTSCRGLFHVMHFLHAEIDTRL